jgi:Ca2+-transporting ATPase
MKITAKEVEAKLKELGVNPSAGLTSSQVEEHRGKYGSNVVDLPEPEPWWKNLLEKFTENPIPILIAAAVLSIALAVFFKHEFPVEGLAILAAVALAVGVGFVNEYKSGVEFEKLKMSRLELPVTVTRGGKELVASINDIVVGDVVQLQTGNKIPADCFLLDGDSMTVDQSRMTGESAPKSKGDDDFLLYGGTDVVYGTGSALVTNVGNNSKWGEIARQLASEEQDKTPLEERLDGLTEIINKVGTWAAILIFLALAIELVVRAFFLKEVLLSPTGQPFIFGLNADTINEFVSFFIIAVTIVVVAVPEGLPMAVNLSLAYSMRKIMEDRNLVRKMMATETIGSANVICSDKTGTLTQNKMTVVHLYLAGNRFEGAHPKYQVHEDLSHLVHLSSTVNSTAHLVENEEGESVPDGNSTEGALLSWVTVNGIDYKKLRDLASVVQRVPFSAEIKRMSSVVKHNGGLLVLTKGAPERVLPLCSEIETEEGPRPIGKFESEIKSELDHMTGQAMRTLALAYKKFPDGNAGEEFEKDMVLLALVGIADPMRQDVPEAIRIAHEAGIDVKMVTGDNLTTATVLARQLGLLAEDSLVLEAIDFRKLSDEDLVGILPKLRVLARAEPMDKYRLVDVLKSMRQVVAVTGDGTNDAPALKHADVGLAMGKSGTEVAKEASDIVLLDDNFQSIVRAVHWGRTLYENIQKFIQFQLTINVSALSVAFLSPLLNIFLVPVFGIRLLEVPLTVIQLLWVNLIMDTLAVLALVTEPPSADTMKRDPIGRTEPFITRTMWENILGMGIYFTIVMLILQATNFLGADMNEPRQFAAMIFAVYVFFQVFNEFNCRVLNPTRSAFSGLSQSRNFLIVIGFIAVVQVLLTHFGGLVFNTAPLPLDLWVKIILLTSTALIFGEIARHLRGRNMSKA